MSSFLIHEAQALFRKHIDRYPLLKIDTLLDWKRIEKRLSEQKTPHLREQGGRPAYPVIPMFKAIVLGQWHSLSDPE